jgi:serine/threonine protein kinase
MDQVVRYSGAFRPAKAVRTVEALARGVQHLHANGLVYRYLRPRTVHVTRDGVPRLAGIGNAVLLDHAPHGAKAEGDIPADAVPWLAPELAARYLGEQGPPLGPATDVYALGNLLLYLLTGRPPSQGGDNRATALGILDGKLLPPGALLPDSPPELDALCRQCLEKDPDRRLRSAKAVADELRRIGNDLAWREKHPPVERPLHRRYLRLMALLLAGVALVSAVYYLALTFRT